MAFINYVNPLLYKFPDTQRSTLANSEMPEAGPQPASSFLFPSNLPQRLESAGASQPVGGPPFTQPEKGMFQGSRQFAPSFGLSSGGGAGFRRLAGGGGA